MTTDPKLAARIEALERSRTSRPAPGRRTGGRKRHAALKSRIAALFLSVVTTGSLSVAFFFMEAGAQTQAAFAALPEPITPGRPTTVVVPPIDSPPQANRGATPAQGEPPTTTPVQVEAFNGRRVSTRFGPVQVQVQVRAGTGELVDVAVVAYPDGDPTSRRINARALPQLRSEALSAQSARLDTISGATYTTRGYEASLQSAIDAVRAAGVEAGAGL
jgi:uncharacterized protein with FMN-binding domain